VGNRGERMDKCVPLIFAANDDFVPYMSVMIQSIMENASPSKNYEIILLHRDIKPETTDNLRKQITAKNNFSLRIINVSKEVKGYSFYTGNSDVLTEETYYRLLVPFLLPEYSKAIYMDGDMVTLVDVANLMDIELKNNLIGAVRDYGSLSDSFYSESDRREYMECELGLKNFRDYFIAGLLILNLEQFRKEYTAEYLMSFAVSKQWRFHDQDILNVLAKERTVLIDSRWNVFQDYGTHRLMPDDLYEEWASSEKDPWIIHYAGDAKPWKMPRVPRAKFFWEYAERSPFIDTINGRLKNNLKVNRIYRLKYYLQYLFPMGSRSRAIVKKCTKPIWKTLKTVLSK